MKWSDAVVLMLVCSALLLASGCVTCTYPGGPTPAGLIFAVVTTPAQSLAVATDNSVKSDKQGMATACGLLGLFAYGDSSIDAAMKNGGITKVHHVDHKVVAIFYSFFFTDQTLVYGE